MWNRTIMSGKTRSTQSRFAKFIAACKENDEPKAMYLVTHEPWDFRATDDDNDTALLVACYFKFDDVALAIYKTDKSQMNHVNNYKNTALIYACEYGLHKTALTLIEDEECNINHVGVHERTAFITACGFNQSIIALGLIATGRCDVNHVDDYKQTAPMWTSDYYANNMLNVVKAILATTIDNAGRLPGQADDDGDTALILACRHRNADVALALIATGCSNPGQVGMFDDTAFINACENGMEDVALALLATGEGNTEHVQTNGYTGMHYAYENKLTKVLAHFKPIQPPNRYLATCALESAIRRDDTCNISLEPLSTYEYALVNGCGHIFGPAAETRISICPCCRAPWIPIKIAITRPDCINT
jgi:hypothetical protein